MSGYYLLIAVIIVVGLAAVAGWYLRQLYLSRLLEADRISTLSQIGMQITSTLDLEKTFDRLYNSVNKLMDAYTFGVGIYHPERQQIDFALAIEGGNRYRPYTRDAKDKNQLAVWCIDHRRTLAINSFEEVEQYIDYQPDIEEGRAFVGSTEASQRIESYLYVPILLKDEVIGILSVQSLRPRAYQPIHLDMMQTLSAYTAIAIDNARTHAELTEALLQLQENEQQLIVQETLASLGTLTAGVAHEINNPTNFALVAAQNLQTDLQEFERFLIALAGESADPKVLEAIHTRVLSIAGHADTVEEGARRITRIVSDLRSFSRPQQDSKPHPTRLGDGLNSTLNLVRTNYRNRVQFDLEVQQDPEVQAVPAQINQVFMNLLVNACQAVVQHHPNGGGKIRIRMWQNGKDLCLSVSDNGQGMPVEVKDRVFEPFFSTKPVGKGTGMGLSISYGIVEAHQGRMEVYSSPGEGSDFRFFLPLAQPGQSAASQFESGAAVGSGLPVKR